MAQIAGPRLGCFSGHEPLSALSHPASLEAQGPLLFQGGGWDQPRRPGYSALAASGLVG